MGDFINFLGNNLADFWTYTGFANATIGHVVMLLVGLFFIYLAIAKEFEPMLLIPIGFGILIGNIPFKDAGLQVGIYEQGSVLNILYQGVTSGWYPPLIFLGIGAMTDFSALISNPKLMLIGAAAQFGIFGAYFLAIMMGFNDKAAAAVSIIGGADGPTSIFLAGKLGQSGLMGPIAVAAYSYMALVPIIQPMAIKAVTTKKERMIRMPYEPGKVSRFTRIAFPIIVTFVAGLVAPASVALVGFLMFGNLIRECGCLNSLSETAQTTLANLITLVLGITISFSMKADQFVSLQTLMIMGLGLFAFIFDSIGGVVFAKFLNLFSKNKVNPMVGAAGISAFPMSARVIEKMGIAEDKTNHLLMHAIGANVSGQVASAVAGGIILGFFM